LKRRPLVIVLDGTLRFRDNSSTPIFGRLAQAVQTLRRANNATGRAKPQKLQWRTSSQFMPLSHNSSILHFTDISFSMPTQPANQSTKFPSTSVPFQFRSQQEIMKRPSSVVVNELDDRVDDGFPSLIIDISRHHHHPPNHFYLYLGRYWQFPLTNSDLNSMPTIHHIACQPRSSYFVSHCCHF
jgi:hypothetical protein